MTLVNSTLDTTSSTSTSNSGVTTSANSGAERAINGVVR